MLSSRKNIVLIFVGIVFVTTGLGCKGGDPAAQKALEQSVTLEWWGVFDPSDAYEPIIRDYQVRHPNIRINYRKLRYAEYEQALLEAWSRGTGPDLLYVHNMWMGKYEDRLLPMPKSISLPAKEVTGLIKKEEKAVFKSYSTPPLNALKDTYVDAVWRDVVRGDKVLGLPVAIDVLALFYNRTLLDQAGILAPPRTWQEVADAVGRLTRQDELSDIIQSGIALGTADNIPRSSDIVALLMLQNGADIIRGGTVVWDEAASGGYRPGVEAVRFYTDFSNIAKEVYTWNGTLPSATEAFVQGRLAMMLGYAYQLPALRAQGPAVDLGVAPVPHINPDGTDARRRAVNVANYWMQTVSSQTKYPNEAWDFLLFLTSHDQAKVFVAAQQRPSARRDLLNDQLKDPVMAPFAQAALTAQTWYSGKNPLAAEGVFASLINDVLEGKESIARSLQFYSRQLAQTL